MGKSIGEKVVLKTCKNQRTARSTFSRC